MLIPLSWADLLIQFWLTDMMMNLMNGLMCLFWLHSLPLWYVVVLLKRLITSCFYVSVTKCRTGFAPGPEIGIFWVLKQDCFHRTFSRCAIGRFSLFSWIVDRWHTDSQQCFNCGRKPHQRKWPAADRTTATSKRRSWLCCWFLHNGH